MSVRRGQTLLTQMSGDELTAFGAALDRYFGETERDGGVEGLWAAMVGTLGLGGIGVPTSRGGLGPATTEAMAVTSALGRAGLALPWAAHWVATRLSEAHANPGSTVPLATNAAEALARARDERSHAWAIAALGVAEAAEMTGLCETMLADTIAFARERRQFGTAISDFQVLRHRMVDMRLSLETSRAMTLVAAQYLDAEHSDRARWSGAASALARNACRVVGEGAVQIHGAMGLTDELRLAKLFRRSVVLSQNCQVSRF